jgi:hypothetical protein
MSQEEPVPHQMTLAKREDTSHALPPDNQSAPRLAVLVPTATKPPTSRRW